MDSDLALCPAQQILCGRIPLSELLNTIVKAIQTGTPELLVFEDVDPKDFAEIRKELRGPFSHWEGYGFRIHWFSSERVLKIVLASNMRASVGAWINKILSRAIRDGLIPEPWDDTMHVMGSPEFDNFVGKYSGSFKEADFTFLPLAGPDGNQPPEFPTVVLESGWSESSTRLRQDTRLWQMGSRMAVRVVLQAKFHLVDQTNRVRLDFWISRVHPDGRPSIHEHYEIFPPPPTPHKNPSISFDEFYGGNCPPGINPDAAIPLDLAWLSEVVGIYTRASGYLPA